MYLTHKIKYNAQICSLKVVHLFGKTIFIYIHTVLWFSTAFTEVTNNPGSHRNSLVTTDVCICSTVYRFETASSGLVLSLKFLRRFKSFRSKFPLIPSKVFLAVLFTSHFMFLEWHILSYFRGFQLIAFIFSHRPARMMSTECKFIPPL